MTRTMGRTPGRAARLLVLAIVLAGIVVADSPAFACDCAQIDVGGRLSEVDGAFVGTSVGRHELGQQRAMITFEVERVVKGDFGPTAVVRTNAHGASCGLEFLDGPRTGLLLDRAENGVWESYLCDQVSPQRLLAFAPDATPPDPGVAPIDPRSGPPWWFFAVVGALAVAGVLLVAGRIRRAA